MCGIIGYTGFRPATTVLLDGLKHLDYRGYDSAGIAVYTNKNITVLKAVGQIQELEKKVPTLASSCGIGHTRWATHGVVNEENAHPHVSTNGKISVIHNGIIDNFIQLKEDLQNKGYTFTSQTDSEIFAHLIQDNYLSLIHI